jgi:transposase InsO family protein
LKRIVADKELLNVVDEHTREALAIQVERRIDADATVNVLDRLVAERGTTPRFIRCDNGPELPPTRCAAGAGSTVRGTSYIEPGSPWQNPYVESFGGRLRDELLAVEAFTSLLEAQVLVQDWRDRVQHLRPHSALGLPDPHRLCQGLDRRPPRTLIADGPPTGVRSPEAARAESPPRTRPRRCINRAKRTTQRGRSTPPRGQEAE